MAGETDSPNSDLGQPTTKHLHPVYTVGNIQHKVCVLDGTKVPYSSWVKLFKLHLRGYKVLSHVDGTTPPAKTDAHFSTWQEIDSHVLQWIYGSISDDLCLRILEPDTTVREAWLKLQNLFHNNKGSRAATLEHEFNNLKLTSMSSLDDYCHRLKELADKLSDVDSPVTPQRLVLQLVRGLPVEYDTVASFINQQIPSFETARSMLQLEQQRKVVRDETVPSPAALVTPASPPPDSQPWSDPPRPPLPKGGHRQPRRPPRGPQRGSSSSSPSLGPASRPTVAATGPQQPYFQAWGPPPPYWTVPPFPYPT
ncbi:uncharacterized protein LOC104898632 [Beta vulgaris subsp. vulgaris]|uniref:uncharacterized protein LOC104898632 n=1 Tax=Beta vulgaris subsp. vulgaris TaxID=3555 RepID=UPI00053F428B|nr:uncharacterized protein LOC104898632 [Beta vulgaris subsp. vulgaris]